MDSTRTVQAVDDPRGDTRSAAVDTQHEEVADVSAPPLLRDASARVEHGVAPAAVNRSGFRLPSWAYMHDTARAVAAARWYLRHADDVGPRVRLYGRPIVRNSGTIVIGDRCRLLSQVAKLELVAMDGGRLEIGERTLLNAGGSYCAGKLVRIGARCLIGPHALILDNDFHRLEPERRLERPESSPIEIGDNVWLGARVIVLRGVTIGADSCIGAGSVVVDDIPPRTFAAGVPARVIKEL